MKNISALFLSTLVVAAVGCKEDEAPTRPKLSFAQPALTVNEDAGTIKVELILDKAHSKDLRIEYALGGTASDQDVVGTANADYRIAKDHGLVKIEAGETSGFIDIEIFSDNTFEPDETIEIAIIDTNTDEIELTADDEMVITIKNDDSQYVASFAAATMTVSERDAVALQSGELVLSRLKIPVQLDKAASSDLVVQYDIKIDFDDNTRNDAIDSLWAFQNQVPSRYYDYYVHGVKGQLTIPAGATTADIEIQLLVDFMFEDDETIEITLKESASVATGTNNKLVITVEEQDGTAIVLQWDDAHTDVDMDMFLWVGEDTTNLTAFLPLAITPSVTNKIEIIFLPTLFADGAFGLSYVYYEGTANPMNFIVGFVDFEDGVVEPIEDIVYFEASYSTANLNPWAEESGTYPPAIVHRFLVEGGTFKFGNIQVPTTGSRLRPESTPRPPRMKMPGKSTVLPFKNYRIR